MPILIKSIGNSYKNVKFTTLKSYFVFFYEQETFLVNATIENNITTHKEMYQKLHYAFAQKDTNYIG